MQASCQSHGPQVLSPWKRIKPMKVKTRFKRMDIFETCRGVLKASLGQAAFAFPVAVASVVRGLASEPVGPTRRARPGAGLAGSTIHSADSRAIGAVGSADCAVSRFACRPDPCCVDVSRAGRRGRPMGP